MIDRSIGIKVLSGLISKKKNIEIVEKYIFDAVDGNNERYKDLLYNCIPGLVGKSKTELIKNHFRMMTKSVR